MLHQVEKPIYSRRHQRPYRFAHRYFFVFIYDINFILIKTFFLYEFPNANSNTISSKFQNIRHQFNR